MKKVFFGWFIVAAGLLLTAYNGTMFIYGFTAFVTPIVATFGWSYAQVSLASSLRGVETGILDPFVGMVADRWSPKILMLVGMCILALGIILISQATNLATFYLGFTVVGAGSAISVIMTPQIVVARWFRKNIGKATGILTTGVPIGGLFTPLLVKSIDAYGWQNTMVYMAVGLLILGTPLSLLFRSKPEDYGLLPDGKRQDDVEVSSTYDTSLDVREALKTKVFWFIGIASIFQMIAMNAMSIHMMPYLASVGMQRSSAAVVIMILSIVSVPSRILYGISADIYRKKYVMASSLGLITAGMVIFGLIDGSSFALVVLFAIVYGIGVAGAAPLRGPTIREYFGAKKFGTIFGLTNVFATIGMVIGAPSAGLVYDTRGVYDPVWFIYAGLTMIGTILILMMPLPSRKLSPVVN